MRRADFLRGVAASVICAAFGRIFSTGATAAQPGALSVKLTIPAAKGGINDLAGRLVARHIGQFLPGNPVVPAVNDETGGVALANRFATAPVADALEIAILQRAVPQLAI